MFRPAPTIPANELMPDQPAKSYTPIRHTRSNQKKDPNYRCGSHTKCQPTKQKTEPSAITNTLHAFSTSSCRPTRPLLILSFLEQTNNEKHKESLPIIRLLS